MTTFTFSSRSERNLAGVNPELIAVIRRALELSPIDFIVIEGVRTQARQKQLVAAGVSQTMNSRHLTGHAVDLMPVDADWDDYTCWLPVLVAVRQAGEELGVTLRFGITWTDNPEDTPAEFLDAPHIQLD